MKKITSKTLKKNLNEGRMEVYSWEGTSNISYGGTAIIIKYLANGRTSKEIYKVIPETFKPRARRYATE